MLTSIAKGLLTRLVAYGVFAAGFWFIYKALLHGGNLRGFLTGILGGTLILFGTYMIVKCRRGTSPALPSSDDDKEQDPGDSLPGSR